MDDTNVTSEMNDLIQQAEEWAKRPVAPVQDLGLNKIPENSIQELRLHKIGQQVLTRAAFLLLEQLGIRNADQFRKYFGNVPTDLDHHDHHEKKKDEADVRPKSLDELEHPSTISPMPAEEFKALLVNGWPLNEPLPSPAQGSRRTSMLADLLPMSPIESEDSENVESSARMTTTTKTPAVRRSAPPQSRRAQQFTTSTPIQADRRRRARSIPDGLNNQSMTTMMTPSKGVNKNASHTNTAFTPTPLAGEGPLENRASRLRRLKMEKTMRANGGIDRNDSRSYLSDSFISNSSFYK